VLILIPGRMDEVNLTSTDTHHERTSLVTTSNYLIRKICYALTIEDRALSNNKTGNPKIRALFNKRNHLD